MDLAGTIARHRRPEYTGANRCLPCTLVNGVLAVVTAVAVAVVTTPGVGAVALAAFAARIYLRGYLVPGTPELTERYVPPWVLRRFGKEPVETTVGAPQNHSAGERPLVAAGVLTETSSGPALTESFTEAWTARTQTVESTGIDDTVVRTAFDAETVSRLGATSFVLDGDTSIRWGSTTALAADVAGAHLLAERVESWREFDRDRRRTTLRALRLCLDRCPTCAATVSSETTAVDPCCQRPHLVMEVACEGCGAAIADAAVVDTGEGVAVPAVLLEW